MDKTVWQRACQRIVDTLPSLRLALWLHNYRGKLCAATAAAALLPLALCVRVKWYVLQFGKRRTAGGESVKR